MAEQTENEAPRPIDKAKELVTETVDKTRDVVGEGLGVARERLKDVSSTASKEIRRGAEQARKVAREKYEVTSEQLRKGYTRVRKDVDGLADDVNEFVRDNPGKSILIAAGAGFLLGLLFRPRRHQE